MISHLGNTVHIHDPGGEIAAAWAACDRNLSAVYDLNEGFQRGVINSVVVGSGLPGSGPYTDWALGGWGEWIPPKPNPNAELHGTSCTYIRVDHGPFTTGMGTTRDGPLGDGSTPPRTGNLTSPELWVELGPGPGGAGDFKNFLVIGTHEDVSGSGKRCLVVQGDASASSTGL